MTRLFFMGLTACAFSIAACANEHAVVENSEDHLSSTPACLDALACASPELPGMETRRWRHVIKAMATIALGAPNHRGRDLVLNPGAPQTVIGKLGYGLTDKDLEDEEVDVFVQRDCASGWEKLGTTLTTSDSHQPAVEGVEAGSGRVFFEIPADKQLGPGLHRVRLVVAGDGSSTELLIDVVPRDTPVFVSDVDGTLTSTETAEYTALLTSATPGTHAGAPEAFRALAARGFRPIYVTARPDWLTQRTRDFLAERGYPRGIVHTSLSPVGAGFGAAASEFKKSELADLQRKGLALRWGFGNMTSDSDAYATAISVPNQRVFFQITGAFSGRNIQSYGELLPELDRLSAACR